MQNRAFSLRLGFRGHLCLLIALLISSSATSAPKCAKGVASSLGGISERGLEKEVYLIGETVFLRSQAVSKEDIQRLVVDRTVNRFIALDYDVVRKTEDLSVAFVQGWHKISTAGAKNLVVPIQTIREEGFLGYVSLKIPSKSSKFAYVEIALLPEAQGRGVAAEALELIERHFIEDVRGPRVLRGMIAAENIASQKLFSRIGYKTNDKVDAHGYLNFDKKVSRSRSRPTH